VARKPIRLSRMQTLADKPYPFMQVIWWDAADSEQTWGTESQAITFGNRPCEIISYGYLVSKSKAYIVLAADRILRNEPSDKEVVFGRITKIPRPWVQKTRTMKVRVK